MSYESVKKVFAKLLAVAVSCAFVTGSLVAASAAPASAALNTGWTLQTPPEPNNNWNGLTYGNGVFVAVGGGGTNRVMTSPDGASWTPRDTTMTNRWRSVTFGGGKFVTVSDAGSPSAKTSTDGVTWTAASSTPGTQWNSVTYGDGKYVAVGSSGASMWSTDGSAWTSASLPNYNWRAVTYGAGKFVAVTSSAATPTGQQVVTSTDGVNWTPQSALATNNNWDGITYGGGQFVAVSSNSPDTYQVMTSPDGVTWTGRTTPGTGKEWTSVVYANGQYVAVADDRSSADSAMVSTDGITWSAQSQSATCKWLAVAYGAQKYVAIANQNNLYGCGTSVVMTSDAIIPTPATASQSPAGNCVTSGGSGTIEADSSRQLMASGCATNAGQDVAVKVSNVDTKSLGNRGDISYYSLYCKVSKTKTTKTRSAGYGSGYRTCKKGSLRIRANAQAAKLKVTWYAPATTGYSQYKKSRNFKIS